MDMLGWYIAGSLWMLGAIGILMLESSSGRKYLFLTKLFVLVVWPFLIFIGMLISVFNLTTSRRVY